MLTRKRGRPRTTHGKTSDREVAERRQIAAAPPRALRMKEDPDSEQTMLLQSLLAVWEEER